MFDKIRGRIREWSKNHPAPTDQPPQKVTHSKYETLERPESRSIATSIRTRWITFGLNRHERRAIIGRMTKVCRDKGVKSIADLVGNGKRGPNRQVEPQLSAELSWLRFQITNSPRNWPSNGGSNNPVFEGQV